MINRLILIVALCLAAAVWGIQAKIQYSEFQKKGLSNLAYHLDFSHYYLSARRALQGSPAIYGVPFSEEERSGKNLVADGSLTTTGVEAPTNPPFLIFLTASLALLPPFQAWLVWTILSLSLLLCALTIYFRSLSYSSHQGLLILVALLGSNAMISNLEFSQTQIIILALLLISLVNLERQPVICGICIGMTVALKFFTVPLLVFLWAANRYRALCASIVSIVLFALLPLLASADLNFFDYYEKGFSITANWAITSSCNQSLAGLLGAYLLIVAPYIPKVDPLSFARAISAGCIIATLCLAWFLGRRFRHQNLVTAAAILIACTVLIAPLAWPHYYLLVWPLIIVLWKNAPSKMLMLLWLSFPLYPVYFGTIASEETVSSLSTSYLVWLPATIFLVTLLILSKRELKRLSS